MIITEFKSPSEDPLIQQVLSDKHGPQARCVLPIDTGQIAVFTSAFKELVAICDTWDEAKSVNVTVSSSIQRELRWRKQEPARRQKKLQEVKLIKSSALSDLEAFLK